MTDIDRPAAAACGIEIVGGRKIGRDPRTMSPDELAALGHVPQPALKIFRAKCLDCCGGDASEVRKCLARSCPLWPYRMSANPFAKRTLTEEQRETKRAQATKLARLRAAVGQNAAVEAENHDKLPCNSKNGHAGKALIPRRSPRTGSTVNRGGRPVGFAADLRAAKTS